MLDEPIFAPPSPLPLINASSKRVAAIFSPVRLAAQIRWPQANRSSATPVPDLASAPVKRVPNKRAISAASGSLRNPSSNAVSKRSKRSCVCTARSAACAEKAPPETKPASSRCGSPRTGAAPGDSGASCPASSPAGAAAAAGEADCASGACVGCAAPARSRSPQPARPAIIASTGSPSAGRMNRFGLRAASGGAGDGCCGSRRTSIGGIRSFPLRRRSPRRRPRFGPPSRRAHRGCGPSRP